MLTTWIDSNNSSILLVLPEIILTAWSILTLLIGGFTHLSKHWSCLLSSLGFITYASMRSQMWGVEAILFSGTIQWDDFSATLSLLFAAVGLLTTVSAYRSCELNSRCFSETLSLIQILTVSLVIMTTAIDMLTIILSIEMVSILSYLLVGFRFNHRASKEAAVKYLLYGAAASGIMVYGLSFLYGLTGSSSVASVAQLFADTQSDTSLIVLFAMACVFVGLAFKMAVFPGHMWCPDVYQGAPLPVTAFLSVGPKAAGFALCLRLFYTFINPVTNELLPMLANVHWDTLIAMVAGITMTLGNLLALEQTNLKRLLAYSSIAHAGYLMMALATFSEAGASALMFYLFAYLLMNFGAFIVVQIISQATGGEELSHVSGIGWNSPLLAAVFSVFLVSLIGLPPFMGFIAKFLVFSAVIEKSMYWLAIVGVLNAVIGLVYYAKILKQMYFVRAPSIAAPDSVLISIATILAIPTLFFGIYWTPLKSTIKPHLHGISATQDLHR